MSANYSYLRKNTALDPILASPHERNRAVSKNRPAGPAVGKRKFKQIFPIQGQRVVVVVFFSCTGQREPFEYEQWRRGTRAFSTAARTSKFVSNLLLSSSLFSPLPPPFCLIVGRILAVLTAVGVGWDGLLATFGSQAKNEEFLVQVTSLQTFRQSMLIWQPHPGFDGTCLAFFNWSPVLVRELLFWYDSSSLGPLTDYIL